MTSETKQKHEVRPCCRAEERKRAAQGSCDRSRTATAAAASRLWRRLCARARGAPPCRACSASPAATRRKPGRAAAAHRRARRRCAPCAAPRGGAARRRRLRTARPAAWCRRAQASDHLQRRPAPQRRGVRALRVGGAAREERRLEAAVVPRTHPAVQRVQLLRGGRLRARAPPPSAPGSMMS